MSSGIFTEDDELIMPFVVCKSSGGPYDDASYIAGWEAGALDRALQLTGHRAVVRNGVRLLLHPDNIPQLDLVAMRHGFILEPEKKKDEDGLVGVVVKMNEPPLP